MGIAGALQKINSLLIITLYNVTMCAVSYKKHPKRPPCILSQIQAIWNFSEAAFLQINNNGWACGYNEYGQLGLGHYNNVSVFTQVTLPLVLRQKSYCA